MTNLRNAINRLHIYVKFYHKTRKTVKETYSVLKLAFNHEALCQSTALIW